MRGTTWTRHLVLWVTLMGAVGCAGGQEAGALFKARPQTEVLAVEPREAPRRPPALDFYKVTLAEDANAAGVAFSVHAAPTSTLVVLGVRVEMGGVFGELSPVPEGPSPVMVAWIPPGKHKPAVSLAYHLLSEKEGKHEVRRGYLPELDVRSGERLRIDLEVGEDVLQRQPTPRLTIGVRTWIVQGTQWREVAVRPHNTDAPTDLEDLVKEKEEP